MEMIQTENGTYVEVTEAEKVAIDKKWDHLEQLTADRIKCAKDAGTYDSRQNYFSWMDNENTKFDPEQCQSRKMYCGYGGGMQLTGTWK